MKFGYTIVYVPSVADTLAFYEKAFGFRIRFLHESGQYGELESGATVLAFASHALGEMNFGGNFVPVSATATPPGIELAFVTEDVSSAYAKAIEAGAVPLHPPAQKPWGQVVAYVRSLEGTLVELCSPIVVD
jgi:lactoylglutathione lyase